MCPSAIYWDAGLFTDSESGEVSISFYSADIETNYRVIAEGVTSAGQPIHARPLLKSQIEALQI
jgi:hypothetical protein